MTRANTNFDEAVIRDFGAEWARFPQAPLSANDRLSMFESYFHLFPWETLPPGAVGADLGCGSGRWAVLVAPKVGRLHVVDASEAALEIARRTLAGAPNVQFHLANVSALPFARESLDFAYSIGVLHHVPDTGRAIKEIAETLRPGAPLLLYLYYAFDNRPRWYKSVWKVADYLRRRISRSPRRVKNLVCELIAALVYWPLARAALLAHELSGTSVNWPLAYYRDKSFYTMRTDALDRFGTRLERRFTKAEIQRMMEEAKLGAMRFSDRVPYWCVVGMKG